MEEIKQKQAEKVKKPRKPKVDVKKVVEKVEEKSISGVHDAFRKFVGKTVIYMFVSGGTIIRQMVLEIPSNFSSWWHKNSFDIITWRTKWAPGSVKKKKVLIENRNRRLASSAV